MPPAVLNESNRHDPDAAQLVAPASREASGDWRDRRGSTRYGQKELQWIRAARLRFGQGVSLLDLSTGGARLDSPIALGPNSVSSLEIISANVETVVQFRVLRCEVGVLSASGLIYRGACEFIRPLDLPDLRRSIPPPAAAPENVRELDVLLQSVVGRLGLPGSAGGFSLAQVLHAVKVLHRRAASVFTDPMGPQLSALLRLVIPALEQRHGLHSVIDGIESRLRSVVPSARVRFGDALRETVQADANAILIGAADLASAGPLVSIEVPKGLVLTLWQSRVLRCTSRVIAIVQRFEPEGPVDVPVPELRPSLASSPVLPDLVTVADPAPPPTAPVAVTVAAEPAMALPADTSASADLQQPRSDPAAGAIGWQKVVVRYVEGQTLKGYTQDFHPSRPHFTLCPNPSQTDGDVVLVPLVRLKALFFVRDFAGNPDYVERTDIVVEPTRGRRIQVTLNDEEVIVGTTLNYRSDGQGFFVRPIDPLANNLLVFVVANSVRQIRFPAAPTRAVG